MPLRRKNGIIFSVGASLTLWFGRHRRIASSAKSVALPVGTVVTVSLHSTRLPETRLEATDGRLITAVNVVLPPGILL